MSELTFFTDMQKAMDEQAEDVWDMVEYSRTSGYRLRLGEVTVTELNFFRLRKFWTKGVYIRANEPDENLTGADWEWLIGHRNNWVQIRVQAKIVNKRGSFAELGHGPAGARGQQMDRLIDQPEEDVVCRWMPLYVFYTATPPSVLQPGHNGGNNPLTGCSAKLAREVRNTYGPHGQRSTLIAGAHLVDSIPWSSVFNGLVRRLGAGESMSDIVDSLAHLRLPEDIQSISDFWEPEVYVEQCQKPLPEYMQEIIKLRGDNFDSAPIVELQIETPESAERGKSFAPRVELEHKIDTGARRPIKSRYLDAPEIPVRRLRLDQRLRGNKPISLPGFVSVIDIEKLPEGYSTI